MHPIAINRGNPRAALKQILQQGLERLKTGKNVLIYPEGTRLAPGKKGRYGQSGAALAIAAKVQIVPVSHNAGYCWPAHGFIKWPGQIHVSIGKPISTGSNTDSRLLTKQIENIIETTQKTLTS